MKFSKRIILASASPRRKEILSSMGLEFEVIPTDADESTVSAKRPARLVKKLSALKANALTADMIGANGLDGDGCIGADNSAGATEPNKDGLQSPTVIGADTVVVFRGEVLGKPHSEENAVNMLKRMQGKWHSVYTGVTVKCADQSVCFSVRSRVKMRALSDEEILNYVKDAKPLDKAGAYGIQDGRVVQKYRGSYTNIVGLPKEKLAKVLAGLGIENGND